MVLILALSELSERSMLEDEFESERLEVWLVLTLALRELRELSTLEDELNNEMLLT